MPFTTRNKHEGNNGELYNRIDEQTDIKRGDASLRSCEG